MLRPRLSFEFFPPRNLDASFRLWETMRALAPLDPVFVSVTYGAGGTTRQLTHEAVTAIGGHYGLNVAAHLTCVEASRAETLSIVDSYAAAGVREIVVLRGDAPQANARFTPRPDGFASSIELITAIAARRDMTIRVGAYPERHPESPDQAADIAWLKRKIDAGATSAITQFFFEAGTFFRFRDACVKAGITVPIIPGILPVQDWNGTCRVARRCGTTVPVRLADAFAKAVRDGREKLLATAVCVELCDRLLEGGVADLHFYTLNSPAMTRDVCGALGILPQPRLDAVA